MMTERPALRAPRLMGLLVLAAAVLVTAGPSRALVGDSYGPFGLDGSIRTINGLVFNYDLPPFFADHDTDFFSQTIGRLTAMGRPSEAFSYEVHLVQTFTHASAVTGSAAGFGLPAGQTQYRAVNAAWEWLAEPKTSARLWPDRFNVKLSWPGLDLTVGRQAVTFGKAYFWNPLDVFLPFDPAQFDRDYKAGVDGLRLDLPLGDFSGLNLLAVAGRQLRSDGQYLNSGRAVDADWYGSALLARGFTNLKGWDMSFQAGKVYGGYHLGAGLVGEIRGWSVRAESVYFLAEDSPPLPWPYQGDLLEDHLTMVAGFGRRFESSLDLEMEILYNGGGEANDLELAMIRMQNGQLQHLGRFILGATATYEITPLLVARLALLLSLTDGSSQVQPSLTYSLSDNAEVLIGAGLYFGPRPDPVPPAGVKLNSEFGAYPNYILAEVKFYF
jgi:hypothetical protein